MGSKQSEDFTQTKPNKNSTKGKKKRKKIDGCEEDGIMTMIRKINKKQETST